MQPPPGYDHPPNKVCRLRKALYGLKQAPREWFAKFSYTIGNLGFKSSSYDHALFLRKTDQCCTLLLLYVDDMIITGDDTNRIRDLKNFLHQQFEMKDLGQLSYFLGLEIASDKSGYYLSQAKYATDLISRAGITDTKVVSTPFDSTEHLAATDGTPLSDETLYRQLVGSLIYLTVTRPNIAYDVHIVSQFMSSPRTTHFSVVLQLRAYSDADWAGDPTDRRSTTGYCFFLGTSLISWRSKKQTVVSRSSIESEYRALADTTSKLLWLQWLLQDMDVPSSAAIPLFCDNNSAMQIAHNDVFHKPQIADIFTKSHPPQCFQDLVSNLKMFNALPP
ncbi:uncharacterized mitochondrial protein AtMg00810-like [Impatiens glandulifera]|uniref:uncharacterized mitochondrial protein AtMg00810-like n=1 Tax=Impatiens glandulifera TaxID=253017 RepID=UPI001FB14B73|nr:uncharacterized mitochondrial protein AtMg00810-like [Impatiens glandulifera]